MSFNDFNFSQTSLPSSQPMLTPTTQTLSLEALFQRIQSLENNQSQFQAILDQLQAAKAEITVLSTRNAQLEAKLRALEGKNFADVTQSPAATQNPTASYPFATNATTMDSKYAPQETVVTTWARTVAKNCPQKLPRKVKRVAAALRMFQEPETNAPQGYQYVYVPRTRKIARSEIRRSLRSIGLDTSRILDINFPARGRMGLLVHAAYVSTVTDTFTSGHVKVDHDLNPQDPKHLEDPKFKDYSAEELAADAIAIHESRCVAALHRLRVQLIPSVGRCFVEQGWVSEATVKDILDYAAASSSVHKKRKTSPPGFAVFGGAAEADADMDSVHSDVLESTPVSPAPASPVGLSQ
jgi:hypothetical protein